MRCALPFFLFTFSLVFGCPRANSPSAPTEPRLQALAGESSTETSGEADIAPPASPTTPVIELGVKQEHVDIPANPNPVVPVGPAPVAEVPNPIRVALYRAPGVSFESHQATLEVLREAGAFRPSIVTPEQVREGILDTFHVVLFTGGRGSVQGQALEASGRQIVRDFVANGGGYIGVCAGSYLAMQGSEEFHKLAIVAVQNFAGDNWRRGTHTLVIQEVGSEARHHLFYANGPVFALVDHPLLPPVRPLATFVSDAYLPAHGTNRGEMPGTPAILASNYGHGRVILFSPNPVLHADGEEPEPELMLQAVRWVATRGPVPETLRFRDVFR